MSGPTPRKQLNPSGMCMCGCGQPVPRATTTQRRVGLYEGDYIRSLPGHAQGRGEGHHHWKGGRSTTAGGQYPVVRDPEHPHANSWGYVPEHVAVASAAIGGPLPPGVQIHHVNGDGHDNTPSNLVICEDHEYHMLLHRRTRALRASGNANAIKCKRCKDWDTRENPDMYVHPSGTYGHHRSCHRKYEAARQRKKKQLAQANLKPVGKGEP